MSDEIISEQQDLEPELEDGYDAYCQYLSLKNHFNSSYDWKKYQGKTNTSRDAYERRKDKKFFQIIQSRHTPLERNQIFLANFVYDKHLWIGEFLAEHCISLWHDWKGRVLRIDYQFEEDMKNSIAEVQRRRRCTPKDALKFLIRKPKNTHPLVLRFLWGGMFTLESYLLLSELLDLRKVYTPFLSDDKIWNDFEHKVERYINFLRPKMNISKAKEILKNIIKE